MPDYDWAKIKAEYIADGKTSYRKLADKYGIPRGTLIRKAVAEKWAVQRSEMENESGTIIKEILITESLSTVETLIKARDTLAKRAAEMALVATKSSDIINLTNALQILAKMTGLQPELDEREQKARIASIEAKSQVQEEDTEAGVFMIPEKWEEDEDG